MADAIDRTAAGAGAPSPATAQPPLPFGWYYYGPYPPPMPPPVAAAAPPDQSQFKEAFDRLSRGDMSPETISKLLGLNDGDFWKGALAGAAAALLASNLPAMLRMFSGTAAPAGEETRD